MLLSRSKAAFNNSHCHNRDDNGNDDGLLVVVECDAGESGGADAALHWRRQN
jgi:hypothetical protein